MKPTKNRVFCKDCGRVKMLFETEMKADNFIRFNSEDIELERGYSPNRSYYCIFCNGWHITSNKESVNIKSKTEKIVELYKKYKEEKLLKRKGKVEIGKKRSDVLIKHLETIEKKIQEIEALLKSGCLDRCNEIFDTSFAELEIAKKFGGLSSRKRNLEDKLINLWKEFKNIKKRIQ